jgi:hypothetical protein
VTPSFELVAPYIGLALGISEEALAHAYRPAHEGEIPAILELRKSVVTEMWWDDERFVRWRYFSRRDSAGEAPYWVFVRDGELLAACGLEPVTLVVDGRPVPAVRTLDIMVKPDLDGLGLGAFMNLALFRHFPIALVTGSNERSHTLLTRMFHHTADLLFWRMPLRARAVVDGKIGSGPLSDVVAWPLDLLLSARRALSRVAVPAGIALEEMTEFDSRVTDLSRRCELEGRVIVRRSDAYLNWRFVQNPRCRYRIFGAFTSDRLEGYLVTRFNLTRPNPLRTAEIVDWLVTPSPGSSRSVLAALVQAGSDALRRDGAWTITCAAVDPGVSAAMQATGFRFRPGEHLPFFVNASDPAHQTRLCVADGWYLTRGDYDVE